MPVIMGVRAGPTVSPGTDGGEPSGHGPSGAPLVRRAGPAVGHGPTRPVQLVWIMSPISCRHLARPLIPTPCRSQRLTAEGLSRSERGRAGSNVAMPRSRHQAPASPRRFRPGNFAWPCEAVAPRRTRPECRRPVHPPAACRVVPSGSTAVPRRLPTHEPRHPARDEQGPAGWAMPIQ